jgi:hypothetical protein
VNSDVVKEALHRRTKVENEREEIVRNLMFSSLPQQGVGGGRERRQQGLGPS